MEIKRYVPKNSFERLAIFIDYHNLEGSLRNEGYSVDILTLRDYLSEGRRLIETFCYIGSRPNNNGDDEKFHRLLRMNGFIVRTKPAKVRPDRSLRCDFDIELTLDVVDFVSQAKPDIVLLISGDGDFVPLVNWLRFRGLRAEVASTQSSISQDLREMANGYVDLCEVIEEIQRRSMETNPQREEVISDGIGNHQRQEGRDSVHSI